MIGLVIPMVFIVGGGLDAAAPVSLSGWLHIVWNGEPRFILIDDQGVAISVVIDEALTRAFGGPRRLNQKRVIITGERVGEPPAPVRVLSIELGTESQ